jgi:putative ABC transport system ATP-binding protein
MKNAEKLLETVGLPEALHKRYPGNLSGGEQQRVGIARSLASGAKVILADEPTGNLDDENTTAIIALLRKQVSERGYCVIIVTHDPEVAAACEVCYQMRNGALVINM